MRVVNVGIVGCGWWSSQVHAPTLVASAGARIAAVCDPDSARRRAFSARFGNPPEYFHLADMLEDGTIDCAVISTPHSTHADLVEQCLLRNVPVLVEKPFTLDPADARKLLALARERRVPVLVDLTYGFHPYAGLIRSVLASGVLGRIVSIDGCFNSQVAQLFHARPDEYAEEGRYGFLPPLASTYSDDRMSGGGQAQTQLSHLVGLLLTEYPGRVRGIAARMSWLKPGIDLAVAVSMVAETGAVISLSSTGSLTSADDRETLLRFDGTEGWLIHDALHGKISASASVLEGVAIPQCHDPYPVGAAVSTLVDCVSRGNRDSWMQNAITAVQTVEIISSCYQSAAEAL